MVWQHWWAVTCDVYHGLTMFWSSLFCKKHIWRMTGVLHIIHHFLYSDIYLDIEWLDQRSFIQWSNFAYSAMCESQTIVKTFLWLTYSHFNVTANTHLFYFLWKIILPILFFSSSFTHLVAMNYMWLLSLRSSFLSSNSMVSKKLYFHSEGSFDTASSDQINSRNAAVDNMWMHIYIVNKEARYRKNIYFSNNICVSFTTHFQNKDL